ncbi:MAG: hypothetical protein Aureis2KO_01580 [Aureisphaera sp.]
MEKVRFAFLCCLSLFIGCDTKKSISDIEGSIELLHSKAVNGPLEVEYLSLEDSSYHYLTSAKKIIIKNPRVTDSLKAVNNYILGHHFRNRQQTDSSLFYYNKAINEIKDSVRYSQEVDYFYYTYESYTKQNKFGDALAIVEDFKTRYDLDKEHGFNTMLYFMYTDVYSLMGDYEKALKYNELELRETIKINDTSYIPAIIARKAKYLYYSGEKEKAFSLLDSLISDNKSYRPFIYVDIYNVYGIYKYYDGDYVTAIDNYKKAIPYIKKKPDPLRMRSDLAVMYMNIAEASIDLKQYNDAQIYLDSVKGIGFEYMELSNQKLYLEYKLRYTAATNTDVKVVVNDLKEIFDFQQNDYEKKFGEELNALKEANQKEKVLEQEKTEANYKNFKMKTALLWGGIGVLLLTFVAVFYYRNNKLKLEKQQLKTQQRLLRAQMNPHFTFNTVSTIGRMIDKKPDTAKKYLLKFSRLLGTIFENSTFDYVSLEKELEALKEYMELQKLRFEKGFNYTIELNTIEPDLVYIPGMLLQPVIENSIIHGFSGIEYLGEIKIELVQNGRFIFCKIEDNGRGIENNIAKKNGASSMELIQSFLEKVSKTKMEYINKADLSKEGRGVIVNFAFPFKETPND